MSTGLSVVGYGVQYHSAVFNDNEIQLFLDLKHTLGTNVLQSLDARKCDGLVRWLFRWAGEEMQFDLCYNESDKGT